MLGFALPAALVAALCLLRTAAALGLALGVRARIAGVVAGVAGWGVLAQDAFGYFHHLHMLYLGAILFGLTDAGSAFSLRPDAPRSPASSLLLLRCWVASIYVWAAIGKLRLDWLDGRALEAFHRVGALRGALADALVATPTSRIICSVAVAFGELVLGPALLWSRTRRVALVFAYGLHALFEIAGRVDSIGWQMAALLPVFFRGGTPRPPQATR
jgi:hypothetical protein